MRGLLFVALLTLAGGQGPADVVFRFKQEMYIFPEDSGEGTVCVTKIGRTLQDNLRVMVRGVRQDGREFRRAELTFTKTENERCDSFPIMDNRIALEEMRTMTFTLSLPEGQRGAVLGDLTQTHVIIQDDDELGISLGSDSDISEDIGAIDVCVAFDKAFARGFQLNVFLSRNQSIEIPAAVPEEDFNIVATSLTVSPGSQQKCFSSLIQVLDDQEPEEKECFVVQIALPAESPELAIINRGTVTYCIIDNDLVPTSATSMVIQRLASSFPTTPSFVVQGTSAVLPPSPTPEVVPTSATSMVIQRLASSFPATPSFVIQGTSVVFPPSPTPEVVPTSATPMVIQRLASSFPATPSFVVQRTSAVLPPSPTPEVVPVSEEIDDLREILDELGGTPLSQNGSEEFFSKAGDIIERTATEDLSEDDRAGPGSIFLQALDRFALEALDDGIQLMEDDDMNIRLEIQEVAPDVATAVTGVASGGNSIVLPPELFQNTGFTSEIRVAAFYYRNLTGLLPNSLPDTDTNTMSSSLLSSVLSAALQCGDRQCDTDDLQLDTPVRITFNHTRVEENSTSLCVFWEYTSSSGDVSGQWSREGCSRNDVESTATLTVCECSHLTHFAILLSPRALEISSEDKFALRVIGYVGFSVSLAGLLLTITAYVFMRSLWNIQSYVLVNLCISLMAAHITFIVGIERTENKDACSSIAVLLQYFFLVAFMWMLMEGVALYLLLVKVFVKRSNTSVIVAFTILSYGVPAVYMGITIPLGFLIPEDGERYYGTSEACWLDSSSGFVWAFIAPVIAIILVNTGFFIMTIAIMYSHGKRTSMEYGAKTWLRTTVSLVVIMGITWVFGVLVFHESLLVFAYIHAIVVGFQGFAIFVLFVPLQKRVRDAYINWWKGKASSMRVSVSINNPSASLTSTLQKYSKAPPSTGTTSENVYLSHLGSPGKPEEAELKKEVEADLASPSPEDSKDPFAPTSTTTFI